jgi:hypothetical protein
VSSTSGSPNFGKHLENLHLPHLFRSFSGAKLPAQDAR